ncbi:MAG: RNA methyltransferase [Deltaproteobacteria bacterium]|nr:RNA methyltransferase [Deltaproteobacteria bacterium]
MQTLLKPKVYVALVHHPVVNKQGDIIASAVTNLDLHDIARAVKTYGGRGYYVVTPLTDQQGLVQKIISHWTSGSGGMRHPKRRDALALVQVAPTLAAVEADISRIEGKAPNTVATSARQGAGRIGFGRLRNLLTEHDPFLLVFGTAWGLAEPLIQAADYTLAPIATGTGYNHLSVRSAVAIVLDRLLGDQGI